MGRKDNIIKKRIQQEQAFNIRSDEAFERTLKRLDGSARYDRDVFLKGEEWFKSGLSLEDAPEEFRNDRNFVRGFNYGSRLAFIEEKQNEKKGNIR